MAISHQRFGPEVGVPRILALLAEYDLPATFFVPGETALRHPGAVERILADGHEIGHHTHRHRSALGHGPNEERRDFELALEALQRYGVSPKGHRAAMWEASWLTPSLIAEHGLTYDSSLMDRDSPYILELGDGAEIAEVPPHWSLDDWEQYAFLPDPPIGSIINSPPQVAAMWKHELDSMRRHGATFVLTCHPFLSGRAGRIEALREVIEHALDSGDVEFKSAATVAEATLADPTSERLKLRPSVDPS
ncbi:MAG: polysaccharide deacetylase [Actinobacteria bacterium]|nr:polysaccharide deacetylase [Actinomycetota bacterium]